MYSQRGGYRKKRKWFSGFWVTLTFLCAVAIGLGAGFAGAKLGLIPPVSRAEAGPSQSPVPEYSSEPQEAAVAITTVVPDPAETAPPEENYLVRAQNGEVCVFQISDTGELIFSHKLPIELEALRPEDRRSFEEGIRLPSRQALISLLEDFSS